MHVTLDSLGCCTVLGLHQPSPQRLQRSRPNMKTLGWTRPRETDKQAVSNKKFRWASRRRREARGGGLGVYSPRGLARRAKAGPRRERGAADAWRETDPARSVPNPTGLSSSAAYGNPILNGTSQVASKPSSKTKRAPARERECSHPSLPPSTPPHHLQRLETQPRYTKTHSKPIVPRQAGRQA